MQATLSPVLQVQLSGLALAVKYSPEYPSKVVTADDQGLITIVDALSEKAGVVTPRLISPLGNNFKQTTLQLWK